MSSDPLCCFVTSPDSGFTVPPLRAFPTKEKSGKYSQALLETYVLCGSRHTPLSTSTCCFV